MRRCVWSLAESSCRDRAQDRDAAALGARFVVLIILCYCSEGVCCVECDGVFSQEHQAAAGEETVGILSALDAILRTADPSSIGLIQASIGHNSAAAAAGWEDRVGGMVRNFPNWVSPQYSSRAPLELSPLPSLAYSLSAKLVVIPASQRIPPNKHDLTIWWLML